MPPRDIFMGMLPPKAPLAGMLPQSATAKLLPKVVVPPAESPVSSVWALLDNACEKSADARASIAVVDVEVEHDGSLSSVEYSLRALRLEARTLAHSLMHDHAISAGDAVATLLDNSAASIVASFAIAGLGAKRVDLNTRVEAHEVAAAMRTTDARLIIASDRYVNKLSRALQILFDETVDLDDVDSRISVCFAARPRASTEAELALPRFNDDVAELMRGVKMTRLSFDLASANRPGVDYIPGGGTDAYDAFISESDEPCLSLLDQVARGDALRWRPHLDEKSLLDCEYQVMFTSGTTTGKPKIVSHTQRQVSMHAVSVAKTCGWERQLHVWLHVAPMFHAMDAFAMYASVFAGVKQITISHDFDVNATLSLIKSENVTLTALTPTHLAMMLRQPSFKHAASSLRAISVGGSIVSDQLVQSFQDACPSCVYFTDYGSTEACGKICTSLGASCSAAALARAGNPMPLFDVTVVKDTTSMQSIEWNDHDRGEILVRGPTVGDGTWLALGDVATVDSTGSVKIVDRVSDVIIVGGENVFSSEVETILLELAAIAECAAFGISDEILGEVVCCAIVYDPTNKISVSLDEVRKHCIERLSDFKRPQSFVVVKSLPKNSAGKVLKRELRMQHQTSDATTTETGAKKSTTDAELLRIVREEFAHAIDRDETLETLDGNTNFMSVGVSSTQAVAFARALAQRLSLSLPSTLLFDHPNLNSVVTHVASLCTPKSVKVQRVHHPPGPTIVNVNIIDTTTTCPCTDSDSSAIPLSRFDVELNFACEADLSSSFIGAGSVRFASTLDDIIAEEDIVACNLSPMEASYVDPQHRLLLRQTLPALYFVRSYTAPQPIAMSVGTFIGCMWNEDYVNLVSTFPCVIRSPSSVLGTASGLSFLTGRIAFAANLSGPAIGVDTACSSSLVACALGLGSILRLECDAATCGGTNLLLSSMTHSKVCRMGALAVDGRCKTLDASADGYGRGEGVSSCLLSSACENYAQATLIHVGVNQDAQSSSLLAPRGAAQAHIISETCSRCAGQLITYELHGTGTQLGDPIEIGALGEAFLSTKIDPGEVSITSAKSSFNHQEGNAGAAGLLRVVQSAVKHCTEPIRHLTSMNSYVLDVLSNHMAHDLSFARLPHATIQRAASCANFGISAFGLSGTNASAALKNRVFGADSKSDNRTALLDRTTWCSIVPPPSVFRQVSSITSTKVQFNATLRTDGHAFPAICIQMFGESTCVLSSSRKAPAFLTKLSLRPLSHVLQNYGMMSCYVTANLRTGSMMITHGAETLTSCHIVDGWNCKHTSNVLLRAPYAKDDKQAATVLALIERRNFRAEDHDFDSACINAVHQLDCVQGKATVLVSVAAFSVRYHQHMLSMTGFLTLPGARASLGGILQFEGLTFKSYKSLVVYPLNWKRFSAHHPHFRLFTDFTKPSADKPSHVVSVSINGEEVRRRVERAVEHTIGRPLSVDERFVTSGMDSFTANELKSELDSVFGFAFPAAVSYDFPSIQTLTAYIEARLRSGTTTSSTSITEARVLATDDYAFLIVGEHTRTAGSGFYMDAVSMPSYWRWDADYWMDVRNTALPRSGGFMEQLIAFDNELFGIPSVESLLLDPQQRTLLECTFTLEHLSRNVVEQSDKLNVFVGITASNYKPDVISRYWGSFHSTMGTGNFPSVAAGRISFTFGFAGRSISVDTACSSSLVACSLAFECWNQQPVNSFSLVCGSMIIVSPAVVIDRFVSNMLSMDCRCKTFSADADGFVPGEATCAVALKSVKTTGKKRVCGVQIAGTAVNQDGRSASLTAPNGPSQQALQQAAMIIARLRGSDADGLHMHGTGTPLGDPIELGAASMTFAESNLSIEASKSSIGHTETAAGIVALARTYATSMLSASLPQVHHLRGINPHCALTIDESKCKFHIPREKSCTRSNHVRNVGVTAFAFQGTNAFAVVRSVFGEYKSSQVFVFEHVDFWPLPELHPQLLAHYKEGDVARFFARIDPRPHAHLLDHIVAGRALYPGTGFQEICAAAARNLSLAPALVRESTIDAPLVVGAQETTTFRTTIRCRTGVTRVTSSSDSTYMRCITQRDHAALTYLRAPERHGGFRQSMNDISMACAFIPARGAHVGYGVHPAALDSALQLGAAVNTSSNKLKVPVGAWAYKSSKCSSTLMFASVCGLNHSLSGASVVGLRLKEMRRISTVKTERSSDAVLKHVYESLWFVTKTARRRTFVSKSRHIHNHSRPHDAVCTATQSLQNSMFSSSLAFEATRDRTVEATRAAFGTAAQENRAIKFESSCHLPMDSTFIERALDCTDRAEGACKECVVESLAMYEARLRHIRATESGRIRNEHTRSKFLCHGRVTGSIDNFLFITGGLGAIGMVTARAFERKEWKLALLSRSGRCRHFGERTGKLVVSIKCDVSCAESRATNSLRTRYFFDNTLEHMFHAAGALADALVSKQTAGSIFITTGAKKLAQSVRMIDATRLLLFCSSLAALTGNPGQMNYSAANAMLDADARDSRRSGMPKVSIQWGGWAEVGMAARDPSIVQRLERIGAAALDPRSGVEIIASMFRADLLCDWSVSRFDWTRIAKTLPAFGVFRDMVGANAPSLHTVGGVKTDGSESRSMSTQDVESKISTVVRTLTGEHVSAETPLMEAGLDSQAAGELVNALEIEFPGTEVPATVVFDYPTVSALASYIADVSGVSDARALMKLDDGTTTRHSDVVANISSADLLLPSNSGDAITCVPYMRWDNTWFREREKSLLPSFSGFLINYELFDSNMFGISSSEAFLMDVQQRSILEGVVATRIARNVMVDDALDDNATGVYCAISSMQYHVEIVNYYLPNNASPFVATGNTLSVAAGRVSFLFCLRGPCFSLDTACSSSIVATHLTMEGLRQGDCSSAHICGVITILGPAVTAIFNASGMLAPDGRCKTCDVAANGYVRGEARGVFLVDAFDIDCMNQSGVAIIGSAINQDGRSSSLTAPNGPSQQAVMKAALCNSEITGRDLQKLQLHGTGTPLGDPIEVGATVAVLQRPQGDPLSLEAIKSHVCHTETASGMVALMQPLVSLVQSTVEQVLHLRWVNPHVESIVGRNATHVSLPRQNLARNTKMCGISSFAFQGTNANSIQRVVLRQSEMRHPVTSLVFTKDRFYPCPLLHPHLNSFSRTFKRGDALRFVAVVDVKSHSHLLDHRVLDRALYPGAAFQELASGAVRMFDARNVLITNSSVPAPLYLSATRSTMFEVELRAPSGQLNVFSGVVTFMRARASTQVQTCVKDSILLRSTCKRVVSKTTTDPGRAFGRVRSSWAEWHDDYFVDPSCLDNALHLGAVMNAGSREVKVPVGVRAYAAQIIPSEQRILRASACNERSNYSLERAHVVGLEVRSMRRAHAPVTNHKKMTYSLNWFASHPCVSESVTKPGHSPTSLESSVSEEVSTAMCAAQQINSTTVSGVKVSTTREENNDAVHGLLRTFGQEARHIRAEGVRFDSSRTHHVAADTTVEFAGESHELVVTANYVYESRIGNTRCKAPVLRSQRVENALAGSPFLVKRVLITGGLGAIGYDYAKCRNASSVFDARILLTSRSGRSSQLDATPFTSLRAINCDARFREDAHPLAPCELDEILHTAGVLYDMSIRRQTASSVRLVVGAKVNTWLNIKQRISDSPTQRTVYCSSIAALSGSSGQSNYAAANAWLDSIAIFSRLRGESSSSIQWGAWSNTGMADAKVLAKVDSMGLGIVTPELGMKTIEQVMSQHAILNVVATPYDFDKFVDAVPVIPRIFRDVAVKKRRSAAKKTSKKFGKVTVRSASEITMKIQSIATDVIGRDISAVEPLMDAGLDSLSGQEMKQQIEDEYNIELSPTAAFDYPTVSALANFVAGELGGEQKDASTEETGPKVSIADVQARVLRITSGVIGRDVDPREPLMDAGLDSLSGQEMKQQIEDEFDVELSATAAFDYPTVHDLANFVADEIGATAITTTLAPSSRAFIEQTQGLAVVRGLDIVAPSPPEADAVRRIPYQRWDHNRYQEVVQKWHGEFLTMSGYNLHVCGFSGMMDRYYRFDSSLFGISALEAGYMDVQQRSLLEGTVKATSAIIRTSVEDTLDGSVSTGVYVGIASCDYADEVIRRYKPSLHPYLVTGTSLNVASGRISFVYNFRGPSISIDTACSSSIVTTHVAFKGMRAREINRTLSCGVQAILSEHLVGVFHSSGMLAADGRCKTLDVNADGYVRAEARGVLLLEMKDGEKSASVVIAGTAVNQDGRSSSLTAPNGPSQKTVIRTALTVSDAQGRDVDALQMHGTGTSLGDPIEVGAAFDVLARADSDRPPTFESIKSHLGHSETAAGIVSIIQETNKLVQSSSSLIFHMRLLNPHLQGLFSSSVKSTTTRIRVPRGCAARRASLASVSGFAFQGTNGNVVLRRLRENCSRGCSQVSFSRERFWPLSEMHPNIVEFQGSHGAMLHFTACFDPRLHTCALECETKAREAIVSSATCLELACGTSRLFSRDPVACESAVLAPVALLTQTATHFAILIDSRSGGVQVKDRCEDREVKLMCRLHRRHFSPAHSDARQYSWVPLQPRARVHNTSRARVREIAKQSYLEYCIDPQSLESAFSVRAATSDAGVLRACARFWFERPVGEGDVVVATSADNFNVGPVRATGTVFKHTFDKVYRTASVSMKSGTREPSHGQPPRAPPPESRETIRRTIRAHCARIIGVDTISGHETLTDLGMDSLTASELRAAIQTNFGLALPVAAAYECPTADALAEYVARASKKPREPIGIATTPSSIDRSVRARARAVVIAILAVVVAVAFVVAVRLAWAILQNR